MVYQGLSTLSSFFDLTTIIPHGINTTGNANRGGEMTTTKVNVGDKIVATRDQYYTVTKGTVMVITKNMRDGDVCARIYDGDDNYPWFMPADSYEMYGQTLAELGVKAGDVVECLTNPNEEYIGQRCTTNGDLEAVLDCGNKFFPEDDVTFGRTYRIISRAHTAPATTPPLWRDMTDAEKGALMLANHEGKGIEFKNNYDTPEWKYIIDPGWFPECAYRIKPTPVTRTVDLLADFQVIGTITLIDGIPDPASIRMASV